MWTLPHRGPVSLALVLALSALLPGAASAQDADADPLPVAGTALEPGRYVSDVVGPSVEFRADEGWVVGEVPAGPIFTLERVDQPGGVLTVTRYDGDVFLDSCDSTSLVEVEPELARLAEVIAGNPYLNPALPEATVIDGHPGIQLDIAVPAFDECQLPFILLWALPIGEGGEFVQVADQQSRFVLLDIEGDVLVIAIETFPGWPFGSFLDDAMTLVESMRIEPGTFVPAAPDASPEASPSPEPSLEVESA